MLWVTGTVSNTYVCVFESSSPERVTTTRREFMDYLKANGDRTSDYAAAELIFGELIGNVVRHAPGRVVVNLSWAEQYASLCVHDEHDAFAPTFVLPDDPLQEYSRGLFIVKALARSVEVIDVIGDGTKVIAELPVRLEAAG